MRGQIQFGESIAIVIVLVILIVLGVVFYSNLERERNVHEGTVRDDLKAIEVAKLVSSLPELKCTGTPVQDKTCIDVEKARAFKAQFEANRLHYARIFGDSQITLYVTYPTTGMIELFDLTTLETTLTPIHSPINIHDPATRKTYFGYLEVRSG